LKTKDYIETSPNPNAFTGEYSLERFPTGIVTLDELIDGGFPRPSAISILGDVGVGKSLLCRQIMWNALRRGFNVLFYLTEESADEMKEGLVRYGWNVDIFEKEAKLKVVDIFSKGAKIAEESVMEPEELMKKSFSFFEILKEGRDYFFRTLRGKDLLVIFDSLSTVFLVMELNKALAFLQNLKMATRAGRCVGIATLHTKVHDDKTENIVRSFSDGIIEMKAIEKGGKIFRYMNISKMSRTKEFAVTTSEKTGLHSVRRFSNIDIASALYLRKGQKFWVWQEEFSIS